jgi:hypothetical protein
MKRLIVVSLFALSTLGFAGCKTSPTADPKAQEACKTSAKDADSCKACCTAAGATGHMFMAGATGCKCL